MKNEAKKQEVAVKEIAYPAVANESWGVEGVDRKDILIPKVLVMQGLSDLVTEGKAQMGDIVNSVTGNILGNLREKDKKPVPFVPISTFKTWVESTINDKGTAEYKQTVPMTPANSDLPWEYMEGTQKMRRDQCLNFYVLNANEPEEFPYVLSFKRTSYRAGKKLSTHFTKCQMAAQRGKPVPPAATTFLLTGQKESNDLGTYYVADVQQGEKTSPELLQLAFDWYQVLKTQTVKVDDSDLAKEVDSSEVSDSEIATERF